MAREFTERSLQVCRDFLQTAVIIDDRAFHKPSVSTPTIAQTPARGGRSTREIQTISSKNERYLDTRVLIKSFADHGIICSALEFTDFSENSISFKKTAKLADIAIIDWEMEDKKTGENALKLISSLLEDDFTSPQRFRLVTIYTATVDLEDISQKIAAHIEKAHNKKLNINQNGLLLVYQSIVITIYAKAPHGIPDHLQFNVVDEDGLPERLVECFTDNISGILPNTALSALTAIRHSTHRLLALFNRNLDYAYLTHRASLPKPNDAGSHLEILIAEEIKSILSSYGCIGSNASFSEIKKWLLERYSQNHEFTLSDSKKLKRDDILEFLKEGCVGAETTCLSKTKRGQLYKHFSSLLSGSVAISTTCDLDLSKLTVLKTRYKNSAPHLTTGVVLQQQRGKSLWVCIQPKCDSVRLKNKSRKFPLLPILPGIGGEATLPKMRDEDIEDFCHILIHPQNSRSIEFKSATTDQSEIYPQQIKGEWIYLTTEKIRFQFIAELKDEIAQNVLNGFAATTARVGINPSEWLRKNGLQRKN